jgi:hypothetical protein
MDRALFRAYIKELVKEQIEDSVEKVVRKLLPEILSEAVAEIKTSQQLADPAPTKKQPLDRSRLAELMGLENLGGTLSATTNKMMIPDNMTQNINLNDPNLKPAVDAINRDYSQLMKKMGMTK